MNLSAFQSSAGPASRECGQQPRPPVAWKHLPRRDRHFPIKREMLRVTGAFAFIFPSSATRGAPLAWGSALRRAAAAWPNPVKYPLQDNAQSLHSSLPFHAEQHAGAIDRWLPNRSARRVQETCTQ